jgi:hypothetical protein
MAECDALLLNCPLLPEIINNGLHCELIAGDTMLVAVPLLSADVEVNGAMLPSSRYRFGSP